MRVSSLTIPETDLPRWSAVRRDFSLPLLSADRRGGWSVAARRRFFPLRRSSAGGMFLRRVSHVRLIRNVGRAAVLRRTSPTPSRSMAWTALGVRLTSAPMRRNCDAFSNTTRHAPFSEARSPRQARRRRRRKYRYEVPSYRCHPFLAGRQNADLQIGYCSSVARGRRHVARATLQGRQTGSGPQTLVVYICRTVIFFSCFFASGPCFGTWSVRIPSLKSAEISSSLTSGGSRNDRWNAP